MAIYIPDSAALLSRLVDLHTTTISEIVADYNSGEQSVEELVMDRCAHDVALEKFIREYHERILKPLNEKIGALTKPLVDDGEIPF